MKNLNRKAQILIIFAILFGVLISIVYLSKLERLDIWVLILAGLTSITQIFKVEGATEKSSYNLSWVLYGFAFLLLGAPATLFIILVSHIVEWVRYKYPWYIQLYNIATYAVSLAMADLVYTAFIPSQIQSTSSYALGLLVALFTFTMTNHILVGLVIWFARGQNFKESGVFGFLTLTIDFSLITLGMAAAMIWVINPFAALFVIAPIILVQNGLKIPALQRQTEVEPKTRLYNAKFFSSSFEKELARAIQFNRPLTLVLGDLDLLRNINNTYGHVAGDVVLLGVATILSESFRDSDLVSRFGGEEFAILMPGTKPEDAVVIVEAVRKQIAAADYEVDTSVSPIKATMSFGISGIFGSPGVPLTTTDLTNDADSALYNAKLSGRNQTCLYSAERIEGLFNIHSETKPLDENQQDKPPIAAHIGSYQKIIGTENTEAQPDTAQKTGEFLKIAEKAESKLPRPYTSIPKVKRPWQVNLYVAIVVAIAAVFAVFSFSQFKEPLDYIGILLFTILILLSEIFSIEIYSKNSSVSTAAAFLITGSLLFGPLGALIFSFTIAATAMYKSRSSVVRLLFNASNHFIASALIITLVSELGTSFSAAPVFYQLILALFSGIVVYASTTFLLTGVLHFSNQQTFIYLWSEHFSWLIPYYLAFGVISFAMILAYTNAGILGLFAIMTPLLILRLSQVQYIDKTKSMVKELRETNTELKQNNELISELNEDILLSLANTIDLRDSYTLGHSTSVSQIAVRIAEEYGLSPEKVDTVRKSSLLHDIGKIGIPDNILFKPDRLSQKEFEIIKTHPTRGAKIVEVNKSLEHLGPIIRHHHEHYDGRGYPDGLQGDHIPLEARILCLSDSAQAMSSNRPYRKKLDCEEVKEEIRNHSGTQFDPALVKIFLELLERGKISLEIPLWKESEVSNYEYLTDLLSKKSF